MTDLETDVPEKIEHLLDDVRSVGRDSFAIIIVQEHHVHVARWILFAATVSAEREQTERSRRESFLLTRESVSRGKNVLQKNIDQVGNPAWSAEEEKFAKTAVDLLNSNGVLCTMETGIPYAPRWICVVGVTGFDRTRNSPEYDQYINKIKQIEAMIKVAHPEVSGIVQGQG